MRTIMLDGDRFIAEQLQGRLSADEPIVHTAYLETDSGRGMLGALRKQAYWAAVTPARLFLIKARVGVLEPLLENKGLEIIERASIVGAARQGSALILALANGHRLAFLVQRAPKLVSGQAGLVDELIARHGEGPVAVTIAKDARAKRALGIFVTLLVFGITGYHYLYGKRAEVSVQCSEEPAGIRCIATHTWGGANAKACWKVELRCKNGSKTVAPACAEVDKDTSATVTVAEQSFNGKAACDEAVGLDVTGLRLE